MPPRGTVKIDIERCKGCEYCVHSCPQKCLSMSTEFNSRGNFYPVLVEPEKCTGCRLCAVMCPDTAIEVYRL